MKPLPNALPNSLDVTRAVGWVTFLELIRDKILYNIVVVSLLLLGMGVLASRLSYIRPDRVILDFGVSAINICCSLVAILTGAGLLTREFDRRTIFVALSRPITKPQFILGKFAGLLLLLTLNGALLSLAFVIILAFTGEGLQASWSAAVAWALVAIWLQCVLLSALAILFSTFSTTSLSVMMCFGLYVIGNNISQIRMVVTRMANPVARWFFDCIAAVLPNLEHFSLGTSVTYGLPVPLSFIGAGVAYAAVYAALLLVGAGLLIQRRE